MKSFLIKLLRQTSTWVNLRLSFLQLSFKFRAYLYFMTPQKDVFYSHDVSDQDKRWRVFLKVFGKIEDQSVISRFLLRPISRLRFGKAIRWVNRVRRSCFPPPLHHRTAHFRYYFPHFRSSEFSRHAYRYFTVSASSHAGKICWVCKHGRTWIWVECGGRIFNACECLRSESDLDTDLIWI